MAKPSRLYLMLDNNLYSPEMMEILQSFSQVMGKLGVGVHYVETEQGFREKTRGTLLPAVEGDSRGHISHYMQLYRDHPDWFELLHTAEDEAYVKALGTVIREKIIPILWHKMSPKMQAAYQAQHAGFTVPPEPPTGTAVASTYAFVKQIQLAAFEALKKLEPSSGITAAEQIDILDAGLLNDVTTPRALAVLQGYYKTACTNKMFAELLTSDEAFRTAKFNSGDRSWEQAVKDILLERPDAADSAVLCITNDGPFVETFRKSLGEKINGLKGCYAVSGTGFLLMLDRLRKHLELGDGAAKGLEFSQAAAVRGLLARDATSQFWQQAVRRDKNLAANGQAPESVTEMVSGLLEEHLGVGAPPETSKEEIVPKHEVRFPTNPSYKEHRQACVRAVEALYKFHTESSKSYSFRFLGIEGSFSGVRKTPGAFTIHGSARNGLYFYPGFFRRIGDVDFKYATNPDHADDHVGDHEAVIRKQLEVAGFTDIVVFKEKMKSGEIRRLKFDMAYTVPGGGDRKYAMHVDVSFDNRVSLLMNQEVTFSGALGPSPIRMEHPFEILANKLVAMLDSHGMSKEPREHALRQAKHIFDASQFMNRNLGYPATEGIHEHITGMFLSGKEGSGMFLMSPDNPITRLRFNLEIAEKLAQPQNAGAITRMGVHDSNLLREDLVGVYKEAFDLGKEEQHYPMEFNAAEYGQLARKRIAEFVAIGEKLLAPFKAINPSAGVKLKNVNTPEAEFVRLLKQGIVDPGMLLNPAERFTHYKPPGWRNPVPRPSFKEQMQAFFTANGHAELCISVDLETLEKELYERIASNTLLRERAQHYAAAKGKDVVVVKYADRPPVLGQQIE